MPSFNTGRGYAPEGQIINYGFAYGKLYFRDVTRCVEGIIRISEEKQHSLYVSGSGAIERFLMNEYDLCAYEGASNEDDLAMFRYLKEL